MGIIDVRFAEEIQYLEIWFINVTRAIMMIMCLVELLILIMIFDMLVVNNKREKSIFIFLP
jgi:hypothetical protein